MYRTIDDFINDWKTEEKATLKLFSKVDDKHLSTKVSENIRSLGRLAWHITQTITWLCAETGLTESDTLEKKPLPGTMNKISDTYKKQSEFLLNGIKNNWNDESLTEKIEMVGEKWERGRTLNMLITHQAHHRGQMTILMRLQGLKVPGIYGPSKEEWSNYGMVPQE